MISVSYHAHQCLEMTARPVSSLLLWSHVIFSTKLQGIELVNTWFSETKEAPNVSILFICRVVRLVFFGFFTVSASVSLVFAIVQLLPGLANKASAMPVQDSLQVHSLPIYNRKSFVWLVQVPHTSVCRWTSLQIKKAIICSWNFSSLVWADDLRQRFLLSSWLVNTMSHFMSMLGGWESLFTCSRTSQARQTRTYIQIWTLDPVGSRSQLAVFRSILEYLQT